jgi:peptidoglycan/LPS O-acetylase OafA/YrhL
VLLEPGTVGQSVAKTLLYAVIGVLLVAAGVWSPADGAFRRTASARVLRHLGHVSYSIFCTHLIVLALLQERMDYELFSGRFPLMWVLTLGLTLAVSELTYWLVERPGMSLARRRRPQVAAQPDTAPRVKTTT